MPFDVGDVELRDFFQRFRVAAYSYRWGNNDSNCLRGIRDQREFCPITATLCVEKGEFRDPEDWEVAAAHLGLNYEIARKIVDATDRCEGYDNAIRANLVNCM